MTHLMPIDTDSLSAKYYQTLQYVQFLRKRLEEKHRNELIEVVTVPFPLVEPPS